MGSATAAHSQSPSAGAAAGLWDLACGALSGFSDSRSPRAAKRSRIIPRKAFRQPPARPSHNKGAGITSDESNGSDPLKKKGAVMPRDGLRELSRRLAKKRPPRPLQQICRRAFSELPFSSKAPSSSAQGRDSPYLILKSASGGKVLQKPRVSAQRREGGSAVTSMPLSFR